jgi:ribosome biogenesis GTPase
VLDTGKHTTTFARLYPLPEGRRHHRQPGHADLRPRPPGWKDLEASFREFRPYAGQCRFRDCRHDAEPGCALRAAAERADRNETPAPVPAVPHRMRAGPAAGPGR